MESTLKKVQTTRCKMETLKWSVGMATFKEPSPAIKL